MSEKPLPESVSSLDGLELSCSCSKYGVYSILVDERRVFDTVNRASVGAVFAFLVGQPEIWQHLRSC